MRVQRLPANPIVTADLSTTIGSNINGPSLIRVPDWLPHPLGRYYLYFAHHQGRHIRLAYADQLAGPWRIYEPGVLALEQSHFVNHIASPDVHVDHESKQVRMFFHGVTSPIDKVLHASWISQTHYGGAQLSRQSVSRDGLRFDVDPALLSPFYLRAFRWQCELFDLGMPGYLYRWNPAQPQFERGPQLFTDAMRHAALWRAGHRLHVFYSNTGDCPESILHARIDLQGHWSSWRVTDEPTLVLEPQTPWEGGHLPLLPSRRGAIHQPARQLRDPCIYEEDGQLYLLYSVAGESGIAIAQLFDVD